MSQDRATAQQRKRTADSHADGIDKRIQHNDNAYTPVAPHRNLGFGPSRGPPLVNEQHASEHARLDVSPYNSTHIVNDRYTDFYKGPHAFVEYTPPHNPYSMQNRVHVRPSLQTPISNPEAMVTPALRTHIAPTQPRHQPAATTSVPKRHWSGPSIGVPNGPGPMARMNSGATFGPALSNSTGPVGYQQQASSVGNRQPLARNTAHPHPELRANPSRRQGFYQQQPPQGYTAQQPSRQIWAQQPPQQVRAQWPQQTGQPTKEQIWGESIQKQLQTPFDYVPAISVVHRVPHHQERPLLLPYDFLLARHLEPRERYLRYRQYHSVLATCHKFPFEFRGLAQALSRKLQDEEYRLLWQWRNENSEKQRLQEFTKAYRLNDLQLGPEVIAVPLERFQINTPANQEIINAAQKLVSAGLPGALQNAAGPAPGYQQPPGLDGTKGTKDAPIIVGEDEDEPVKTTSMTRLDGMNPAVKRGAPTATATTPKVPRTDAYNKPVDIIVISDDVDEALSSAPVSGPVRAPTSVSGPSSAPSRGQAPGLASTSDPTLVPGPVRSPYFFSSSQSGTTPASGSIPLNATTPNTEASIDPDSAPAPASASKSPQGPAKVLDNQDFKEWTANWTREKAIVDSTLPGNLSKQLAAAVHSGKFKFRTAWEAYVAAEEAQRNAGKVQEETAARIKAQEEARRAANKAYKDRVREKKRQAEAEEEEDEEEEGAPEAVGQVSQQGAASSDRQQKQQQEQPQETQNENERYVNEDLVEDALLWLNDEAEEGSPAPSLIDEQQTVEEDQNDLLQDALALLDEESESWLASDDDSSPARRAGQGTEVDRPSGLATGLSQENLQSQSPGDASLGSVEKDYPAEDSDEDLDSLFEDDEEFAASNEDQDMDSLFVGNDNESKASSANPVEMDHAIEEEPVVFLASGLEDSDEESGIQSQTAEQEDAEATSSDDSDESDVSDADDPDSEEEEEQDAVLEEERRFVAGMHAQIANYQKQMETTKNQPYKARLQGLIAEKNEQLRQYKDRGL